MSSKIERQAEYELLAKVHRELLQEGIDLRDSSDGAALQDHNRKLRAYKIALDAYLLEHKAAKRA